MFTVRSLSYLPIAIILLGIHEAKGNVAEHTSFCLYTRSSGNECSKIVYNDSTTINRTLFSIEKPTKIIIPGWIDPLYNEKSFVRKAYLEALDVNVIAFDYLYYTVTAREMIVPIGKFVAEFIEWLVQETGASLHSMHVIGFSIGGQLAGVIGEHITTGKLGRITGLDPLGQTFSSSSTSGRLDSSDATFVDVIHTCDGVLGYSEPCGHVDFYPNGGAFFQPGCPFLDFGVFSHMRSYKLFVESMFSKNFEAQSCDSWEHYKKGLCGNGTNATMGEHVELTARGTYYLRTASKSPFALG